MGAANRLFKPPDASERSAAVGNLSDPREAEPKFKSFLEMGNDNLEFFRPIPVPGMYDWLATHPEPGQTFDEWFTLLGKNEVQYGPRRVIYILPILKSSPDGSQENPSQFLHLLKEYAEAFFIGLDVMILPSVLSTTLGCKTRVREVVEGVKREQMLATDILSFIQEDMPYDAYCVIGVTMVDLYPRDSWNFVFGMASLVKRSGIFSFARYHPNFLSNKEVNDTMESILELPPDLLRLGVRRSFEIFTHEVTHMFGVQHCIYFACLMNGSNHQEESDSRPIFLCPVCLRKLKHALNFDTCKRYEGMLKVFRAVDKRYPLPKKDDSEMSKTKVTDGSADKAASNLSIGQDADSTDDQCQDPDQSSSEHLEKGAPTSVKQPKEETITALAGGEEEVEVKEISGARKDEDKITECTKWLTKTTEYFTSA